MADETQQLQVPAEHRSLGAALSWARGRRGLSMRALAQLVGVSPPFLSDVEHDRRSLSDGTASRIAAALGLDVADLNERRGWSRDLGEWISRDPDLVRVLREAQRSGRRVQLAPSLMAAVREAV